MLVFFVTSISWLSHEVISVSTFPHVSPKLRGWKCYVVVHSMRVGSYYHLDTMILVGMTESFGSWQRYFLISSDQLWSDLKFRRGTPPFFRRLMLSAREEDFLGHQGNEKIMRFQHLGSLQGCNKLRSVSNGVSSVASLNSNGYVPRTSPSPPRLPPPRPWTTTMPGPVRGALVARQEVVTWCIGSTHG